MQTGGPRLISGLALHGYPMIFWVTEHPKKEMRVKGHQAEELESFHPLF